LAASVFRFALGARTALLHLPPMDGLAGLMSGGCWHGSSVEEGAAQATAWRPFTGSGGSRSALTHPLVAAARCPLEETDRGQGEAPCPSDLLFSLAQCKCITSHAWCLARTLDSHPAFPASVTGRSGRPLKPRQACATCLSISPLSLLEHWSTLDQSSYSHLSEGDTRIPRA